MRSRRPIRRSACASPARPSLAGIRCSLPARSKCRTKAASSSATWSRRSARKWSSTSARGAGGKTLLLGALMRSQGRLYAFDIARPAPRESASRGSRAPAFERASATDSRTSATRRSSASPARSIACSSTPRARGSAPAPQSRSQAAAAMIGAACSVAVKRLTDPQHAAATLVKPGGRLSSTRPAACCPSENDEVV